MGAAAQDKKSGQEEVLWEVTPEVRGQRLKRFTVPLEEQTQWESAKLWLQVRLKYMDTFV
jgi:hypothetical protein